MSDQAVLSADQSRTTWTGGHGSDKYPLCESLGKSIEHWGTWGVTVNGNDFS